VPLLFIALTFVLVTTATLPAAVTAATDQVPAVRDSASYTSGSVTRLAGPDRYATAAAVSKAVFAAGVPVAYVATGGNFPDALAAGPAAARQGGPLLLVSHTAVPSATAGELERLKPGRIVLVGGDAAVSSSVATALANAIATVAPTACPSTLQSMVDAAAPGATVNVPVCTYAETVTITKPLMLTTAGAKVDGQGTRKYAFVVKANDVTIDGFEVTGTVNPAQEGAVHVRSSSRFSLRNAYIHHTGGACLSVSGGSGHRIVDSELAYCAQQGFHLPNVSDTVVARNRIHHNNPNRAYDMNWEAGGGKAVRVLRVTFEGNDVYANGGPGLWCDIDCRTVTYRNNRLHHNDWAGIMFEISDGAVITGNSAWENGWNKRTWGWGAGILIASSRNVEVTGNLVAWNADGISVISQNREGHYGWQPGVSTWNSVVNVNVHRNDIAVAPQASDTTDKFMLAWLQDWSGVMFQSNSNNRGANNRYWHAQSEPTTRFAWSGGKSRLNDFSATPGDSSARYLTKAEMTSLLQAAAMPTSAESR
jgi:hypothetical protein